MGTWLGHSDPITKSPFCRIRGQHPVLQIPSRWLHRQQIGRAPQTLSTLPKTERGVQHRTFSRSLPCSSQISLLALSASWLSCSSFSWTRLRVESSSRSFSLTERLSCSFSACRVSSWALSSVPACQEGQETPVTHGVIAPQLQKGLRTCSARDTDGLDPH